MLYVPIFPYLKWNKMIEIKLTLPEEQVEEFLSQWQQLLADVEQIKKRVNAASN